MNAEELRQQMEGARARIRELQDELAETNRGLLALTMELEQRVDQRTAALQASEAQLQTTLENLSEGVVVSDAAGNILHWNRSGLAMHGYTNLEEGRRAVAEFVDTFELSTLDGSVLPLEQWPLPRVLRGELLRDWELRVRRIRGDWHRIFSYSGSLVRDAEERPVLAVLSINDVTERRVAEEDARLRAAALEAAANSIAITDASGTLLWVNQAFCELTGYERGEVIGQNHRILKSGRQDEAFYRQLWATIRRGDVWHGELVNRRKDGTLYVEEQTIAPLRNGAGAIINFIAVKQDISTRKAEQEALAAAKVSAERAKAAAEDATQAKDHFLAVLSHELRTPLAPVMTTLAMLQSQNRWDGATQESLELVRRNVELEARLIDDLLDVTRIARGKIELDRKPTVLCEVIRRAVEVVQADMEARQLQFAVDIQDGPYTVDGDATRLQQVFWNLLRNAIKFTPHGGRIDVRCHKDGARDVIVEVRDTGEGIAPHALVRIFNAFEQAERSITRQFGGLGLGLAISKALLELHGGSIEAFSEGKGKGATFRVRLPTVAAELPLEVPLAASATVRPLRILLVEDHGDTAKVMRQLLLLKGHTVACAGDAASALEIAGAQAFDLILSDLGLPDRSGLELVRELRVRGVKAPAIALSGYGQEEDVRRSKEAGFSAHLTKPVRTEHLADAIAAIAGARPAHDPIA